MTRSMEIDPVPVGDVLDRAMRALGTPSARSVEIVFNRWREVVGPAMASRTRPARIDGNTLVLTCDEPALVTHLRYLERELLERIAELSGERRVSRIELRVDRSAGRPTHPRSHPEGAR